MPKAPIRARPRGAEAVADSSLCLELRVTKASDQVVVDHAGGLHVGVADGRADELETAIEQVLAHRIGFGRARRHAFHAAPPVLFRFAADEAPDVAIERTELLLYGEKGI